MVCLCISEVFHNHFGTKASKTVPFRKINSAVCLHFYFSIFGSRLYTFLHCIWTVFIKYTYAIRIWGLVIFVSLQNNFFGLAEVAELAVAEVAEAETEKSHEMKFVVSLFQKFWPPHADAQTAAWVDQAEYYLSGLRMPDGNTCIEMEIRKELCLCV